MNPRSHPTLLALLAILAILAIGSNGQLATTEPCTVQTGDAQIILNLVESLGDQIDQVTSPQELPIAGIPGTDIQLEILPPEERQGSSRQFFSLSGKRISLQEPLDRDARDLSSLMFQLTCTDLKSERRKTIPVVVTISDINDNKPEFVGTPYVVTIPEATPVNTTIFRGLEAHDPDSNVNGQVEFSIVRGPERPDESEQARDGFGVFAIDLPHQGLVRVAKPLDYETDRQYFLTIVASDRAVDPSNRFSSTTTLMVNILDSNDLDPVFPEELYTAKVTSGLANPALEIKPEKIRAQDQDTLRSRIRYTIESGSPPEYKDFFAMDPNTAVVKQLQPVEKARFNRFELVIKATEDEIGGTGRSATARLQIQVLAEDVNPPRLSVNSKEAYVVENAEVGTKVADKRDRPIKFAVVDADWDSDASLPHADYVYELTTSFFRVDEDGFLVVTEEGLDRDPPNESTLSFQVFVREKDGNRKTSSPVSITVFIKDVNDNSPVLAAVKDVILSAGTTRRVIAKLNATDNDSDKKLRYRLVRVSNNGKNRFVVNSRTGVVEVVAPVEAGERFSLTMGVTDSGGKSSEGIMEVRVNSGPNLRGPVFNQFLYEAPVSEGATKFTSVLTTQAKDPEGEPVRYSLVGGNEEGHFQIEESTGVIRVMHPLDRETKRLYKLTVRAEDPEGKAGTASVNLIVTDINDMNPVFVDTPYSFRVLEGVAGAPVGRVRATDQDSGDNAIIYYSVPEESLFEIDAVGGEIRTRNTKLDFEQQPVHYLTVTANDGAKRGTERMATATVTILVQDASDEIPFFPTEVYNVNVPENVDDYLVATVQAQDKDTEPSITYRLIQGHLDKFMINPQTGVVKTIRGLDYEFRKTYRLVIGTEEARLAGKSSSDRDGEGNAFACTIEVTVDDRNDLQPLFTRTPRSNYIEVRNDAAIGTVIGNVQASDADGSSPNNQVRYELTESGSSERSTKYFAIDKESGDISIRDDLTQELYDEYRLEVRSFDLGEPSLDSTVLIVVQVQQVVTVAPDSGVGFAELSHSADASEGAQEGSLIKTLLLAQKGPLQKGLRVDCDITSVTATTASSEKRVLAKGAFIGQLNRNGDCDLILGKYNLDHETDQELDVDMRLTTLSAYANPSRMKAKITVNVVDINDNSPQFIYDSGISDLVTDQYLVAIPDATSVGAGIFHIKAEDADSGEYGRIAYDLVGDDLAADFFEVNSESGVVSTKASFIGSAIEEGDLPFELIVVARDNPNDLEGSLTQKTMLVVNLLRPGDGIVLTISDTPPGEMAKKKHILVDLLQRQTGLVVEIDRMLPAMSLKKNQNQTACCDVDPTATDVYFHVVDPATNKILPYDHEKVQRTITGKKAASTLKYAVAGQLSAQASSIHEPYVTTYMTPLLETEGGNAAPIRTASINSGFEGFPAALIAFGCLVFALALAAMAYLCVIKRRLQNTENKQTKTIVIPRYEPVFVEPNLKEYETQVLQMSVPMDEFGEDGRAAGGAAGQLGRGQRGSRSGIDLDSISYITKDRFSYGEHSPGTSSDHTGTTSATFRPTNEISISTDDHLAGHYSSLGDSYHDTPIRNPLFGREDTDGLHRLSASTTNANVLFGEPPHNREFVSSTPRGRKSSTEEGLQPLTPEAVRGTTQL